MNDNIVAISTAPGVGAISIIRLSGNDVIDIVDSIFSSDLKNAQSHSINYGYIIDNSEVIDEVLISVMRSPKTYTKEDVVEINCHGGIATTNKILEIILTKGVRLADQGEFTKRAFLNGRIDLTKAESVMDLIESKSDLSRKLAIEGLQGKVFNLIDSFRNDIKDLLSQIEVNIDYPEYNDIEVITIDNIKDKVSLMKEKLNEIINESKNSKIIKEGINTLIIGRPNVGKSSILNKLIDEDKAIVTNTPGTTRDIVEGKILLNNILLNIIDTAGIRKTDDEIEQIGVEKSLSLIDKADLVIVVLNSNEELTKEDKDILEKVKDKPVIVVLNKNDLEQNLNKEELSNYNIVSTNTNSYEGIKELTDEIIKLFNLEKIESKDYNYLTNARQISKAKEALEKLNDVEKGINEEIPIDMIEIDLKDIFDILGEIIGKTYSDEIIDNLFEKFCVGK